MSWGLLSKALRNERGQAKIDPPSRDYGLHTLVPKASDALDHVDIIAVHGLNGHYLKTWTEPKTGINWLKNLIPQFLPQARVMSFWYNSQVQFSKSTADILTFSQQLLECVLAERTTFEESHRPIIFICHSLGGLVFKQAMIRAHENERYHATLAFRVHGVMFFGTPHRGTSLATWAAATANALRAASLSLSTNARLAKDLEPESRLLQYISASFVDIWGTRLKVASFYETRKMDFWNGLIVEPESATLNIVGETKVALDGDHRSMCHFPVLSAAQFAPVKETLTSLVDSSSAGIKRSAEEVASFLESINTSAYAGHKRRIPSPVQGTCTWILDHPKYLAWLDRAGPALLWISADAGCGKSVLASFLIDKLRAYSQITGINVCYFFFKADNLDQSSAAAAVKALLYQLCKQQRRLTSSAMAALQGRSIDDADALWQAIIYATQQKAARNTICILDGLDECDAGLRGRLMRQLTASFASNESSERPSGQISEKVDVCDSNGSHNEPVSRLQQPKLKVLVTSRPENQLKVAFQSNVDMTGGRSGESESNCALLRLRGEDETDAISEDINKVIASKVDDLIYQGFPLELLQTYQTELIKRADRTFLWVSLILDLLGQKVEAGASRRELDELLHNKDIFRIYSELLELRSSSPRARKMLSIILGAARPLSVDELSIALAIEPEPGVPREGKRTMDDVEYELVYPFENHIKSLCGHFVRIVRSRIYLVHETAREFLLTYKEQPGLPSEFWAPNQSSTQEPSTSPKSSTLLGSTVPFQHSFSIWNAHHLLLGICTTYLYCLGRESKCANLGSTSERTEPFLDYAAKNWAVHYHQVTQNQHSVLSPNTEYYQNLCHPMFPGFKLWIEAYWYPDLTPDLLYNDDQWQDYYLELFMLWPSNPSVTSEHVDVGLTEPRTDTSPEDLEGDDDDDDDDVGDLSFDLFWEDDKKDAMPFRDDAIEIPTVLQKRRGSHVAERSWNRTQQVPTVESRPSSFIRANYFPLRVDKSGHVSLMHGTPAARRSKT